MKKPVIVAIGYNRIGPLRRLLSSLERAVYPEDVTLIISLDYSGDDEIVHMANSFNWPYGKKIVRTFDENQGLKKHVLSCADYSHDYGAAIILEDDIVVSPYFYSYAQKAWEYYEKDKNVVSIALYSQKWNGFANRRFEPINRGYDVYASQKNASWGQCIIGERWKEFREWLSNHDGELAKDNRVPQSILTWKKSWCKYFNYYIDTHNKFVITPYISLTTNFNDVGTHMIGNNSFQQSLLMGEKEWNFGEVNSLPKYDDFGDSMELADLLKKKYRKSVCVDFYGIRSNREEYDLCLSSAILPYEIYDSYGLEMKPYELNIIYDVTGDGIYIYDMKRKLAKAKNWKQHYKMIKYDVCDLQRIDSLFYYIYSRLHRIN